MAFLQKNDKGGIEFFPSAGDPNFNEWTYVTQDSYEVVVMPRYFDDFKESPPRPGDTLRVYQLKNRYDRASLVSAFLLYVKDWKQSQFIQLWRWPSAQTPSP